MTGRHRFAIRARLALLGLFMLVIVAQFLTAGYGFFEGDFDTHEGLGWTLAHLLPVLVLVATAVLWRGGTQLWLALALGVLGIVQPMLGAAGGWAGVVHPLVALVLFVLSHTLLRRDLAVARGPVAATA